MSGHAGISQGKRLAPLRWLSVGSLCVLALALGYCGTLSADDKTPPPTSELMLDPATLVGEHTCKGRNPDGSIYEGIVRIRLKNGVILIQWDINKKQSYGTGLVEGMTLGVALESGVAIYKIVPQAEGKSLVGLWATEGAEKACEETIYIGNPDISKADFAVPEINGTYRAFPTAPVDVVISGGNVLKKLNFQEGKTSTPAEGLLLGDGLAVITVEGLSVFQIFQDKKGNPYLWGHSIEKSGEVTSVELQQVK